MIDLAIRQKTGTVTLNDIANHQEISLSYLEQLFAMLRRQGLVHGIRGPGGGYRLAREADTITIANIIDAVQEKVDITRCHGKSDCHDGEPCLTHTLWELLSTKVHDFLDAITLAEVVNWPSVRAVAARQDDQSENKEFTAQETPHKAVIND